MSPRAELDQYLDQVRAELRRVLCLRGAVVAVAALLLLTLLAAFALGRTGFSPVVVLIARVLGVLAIGVCAGGVWWMLRREARDDGATMLERALPDQGGRVETYLQQRRREAQGAASPLIELLAEDASFIAQRTPVAEAVPRGRWIWPGIAALLVAALLGVLIAAGPGLWGDGARRVWLGVKPPAERIAEAAGGIAVQPGDVTVRRNQDLPVSALVRGGAGEVRLHVRFGEEGAWEAAPMEADGSGGYRFTLFALREPASYYVSAGRLKSREHRVDVVDLPQIESLRLTYSYPSWTGLKQRVEEAGGDIRAVEGTRVALEVVTNAPMEAPLLVVNGSEDGMRQSGITSKGELVVSQPGHYRIATRFGDEVVALTEDFVIDVVPDEKPNVQILRPGRDYQATNIEEVPVSIKAQDDFRLEALELHYSVNGGEWRREKLAAGATDIQAAALLRLEEMQQPGPGGSEPLLVPGDLVSYYALARDRRHSVQTDLFLIQVQPFDRRFTQSQAGGGGGGGGGDDEGVISQRQREVLLATWNLQRGAQTTDQREGERLADSARMLAEVQNTLAEQANTLVERVQARLLTGADENVRRFVESLTEAVKAMRPAAQSLGERKLEQAVAHEQRALQHLLRAESTFRDIQVAMQGNAAGGGGGGQAGRDVAEMTELELDLEKNQYETEPQMTAQQQSEAEDETQRKLRELARRQEQLAREARRNTAQPEAQRWQQEQLRREAEELRRQLEQLAQQQQQQQQRGNQSGQQQSQQGQQQGQQQAQQRGQQGGQPGSSSSSAAEAAEQVAQAMRNMQSGDPESVRRAGQQLERAREQLERSRQQAIGESFEDMERTARALLDRQRRTEQELRAAMANRPPPSIANPRNAQGGLTDERAERLAGEKRGLQSELEALQRQMRQSQQRGRERAPQASERVAQESAALDELGTAAGLARSALEIERGRGAPAAMRDPLITQSLEQLASGLADAAGLAAGENRSAATGGAGSRRAEAGDLLAELGELRRAIEGARETSGRAAPGDDLQPQVRASSERLGQLRQSLQPGALTSPDMAALRELSEQMRRAGSDPMASEYQRMVALVDQLELAALRAERAGRAENAARTDGVDDPGRYRDNVAEYYRRLGGGQ